MVFMMPWEGMFLFQSPESHCLYGVMKGVPALKRVVIIDVFGKLKLAKWRLMGDKIDVMYLTQLPDPEQIVSEAPGLILMHLNGSPKITFLFSQIREIAPYIPVITVVKNEDEQLIKYVFSKGAKAVLSLPLDLPKLSYICTKELAAFYERCHGQESEKEVSPPAEKGTLANLKGRYGPSSGELVFNQLDIGIVYIGLNGKIITANKAFKKMMDLENTEIEGYTLAELATIKASPFWNTLRDMAEDCLQKESGIKNMEISLRSAQGGTIYGKVAVNSVPGENGLQAGVLATIIPCDFLKASDADMARSEKLAVAGQLAAGAVHEIKNPLTSVRGFIQLLQQELSGNPKAEYIDIIIAEIDRVNNIVNEFLKLAKPAVPKRSSCSITALFEEIRVLMESEAFLKNVIIEENFCHLPSVNIDKEQIKQVLINIIQNSFDAMPQGGRLTIHAEPLKTEKKIKIQFNDTGCGMDKETQGRIFEPFFTTKEQGTGLGLAVSQQIIESHGGQIEIDSEPGVGTTTVIFLPY